MKKTVFNWMLAAALMFGLCITVTSCSDDDDNKSEEQKEQEAQVKSSKFWSVVGQLVSVDDVTDDYEGKTFEPTYGMPDGTNATTRIVNTNDMRTAAQRFANLVDVESIDENTPSYSWSDPEIGSMTYTRVGTPAEWATVDVDIKAIPQLQRIIYRAGGEGDNGKFSGKAYYRFGDVVSRQVAITFDQKKNNDNRRTITEYWICVRPSFGPEGKEDSHWVCVNTVSDQNYKYYKASTGTEYWVPTNLKTDKENMQNFAEMLWAICYPDNWFTNAFEHHTDGKLWGFDGLPIFTDFTYKHLSLHNANFWKNVQKGWEKAEVARKALNLPDLKYLIEKLDDKSVGNNPNGVHLLYNGYSWWFTTSWDCQLWEAVYTNGPNEKYEEKNLHHVEYNKLEKNMKGFKFDVRSMGQDIDNYRYYFGDEKIRWVFRHATGKELATDKKYDVKKPITGVTEEYRYYRDVVPTTNLNDDPEPTPKSENPSEPTGTKLETPVVGCFVGKDGQFYSDKAAADRLGSGAVAMVVYYNPNDRVDSQMGFSGLAMALQDVGQVAWDTSKNGNDCLTGEAHVEEKADGLQNSMNGILTTQRLATRTCGKGDHPAAQLCQTMDPINKAGFSNWFLPSTGQWIKAFTGMGMTWNGTAFVKEAQKSADIVGRYMKTDGCQPLDGYYWSSTERGSQFAWSITARPAIDPYEIDSKYKTYEWKVRPFIAFGNNGNTEDRGVDKAQAKVGYILATNGKFYKDQTDLAISGKTGAAIVVYKGSKTVESGSNYTGLALSLKPTTETYLWKGGSNKCYEAKAACYFNQETEKLNGLAVTQRLGEGTCSDCGGTHPIFQATKTFQPTISGTGFSAWFVPSTGQWLRMLEAYGAKTSYTLDNYEEEFKTEWGEPFRIPGIWKLHIAISYDNYHKMRDAFSEARAEWAKNQYWTANYFDYAGHYDRAFVFSMSDDPWSGSAREDREDLFGVEIFNAYRDHIALPLRPMIAF